MIALLCLPSSLAAVMSVAVSLGAVGVIAVFPDHAHMLFIAVWR